MDACHGGAGMRVDSGPIFGPPGPGVNRLRLIRYVCLLPRKAGISGLDWDMGERDYGLFLVALSIIGTVMWVASWLFVERDYVDYAAILLIAIMGLTAGVLYMED